MERKFGIQLGKFFLGATTQKSYAPFSENLEDAADGRNTSWVVSDGNFGAILSALREHYSDSNLIELFGSVAEIYAPVDAIASRVIAGTFQLKRKKDDAIVSDNAEFNKLIQSPNPFQNFQQLLYEAICYELVTGKNYLLSVIPETRGRMDYKYVMSSLNLAPDRVKILTDQRIKLFSATKKGDVVKGYVFCEGTEDEQKFTTESILHRRHVDLNWKGKKLAGRSPLLSAEKAIANLIAVYEARNVIYVKRGALGAIVSKKTDASGNVALTKTEKDNVRKDFNKSYGVQKGKSPMIITDQPVDFLRIAMSIQELQPFDETLADASVIYAVLGVPRELMPQRDNGATFENQKIAERGFFQNKVIPLAKSWCQSLTSFWALDQAGYYIDVDFSGLEVLQANKKEQSEVLEKNVTSYTQLYKDGGITYNQWLIALGYEARGPEFDKYIEDLKSVPMAVKIGVGGTQAMIAVIADPNLSEEAKANMLVLLFGISEDQARSVVVQAAVTQNQNQPTA